MAQGTLVRVTSYRCSPRRENSATLNHSLNTHAPDQTIYRPRLIHCVVYLAFYAEHFHPVEVDASQGTKAEKS
jgi:hypothetical protein